MSLSHLMDYRIYVCWVTEQFLVFKIYVSLLLHPTFSICRWVAKPLMSNLTSRHSSNARMHFCSSSSQFSISTFVGLRSNFLSSKFTFLCSSTQPTFPSVGWVAKPLMPNLSSRHPSNTRMHFCSSSSRISISTFVGVRSKQLPSKQKDLHFFTQPSPLIPLSSFNPPYLNYPSISTCCLYILWYNFGNLVPGYL